MPTKTKSTEPIFNDKPTSLPSILAGESPTEDESFLQLSAPEQGLIRRACLETLRSEEFVKKLEDACFQDQLHNVHVNHAEMVEFFARIRRYLSTEGRENCSLADAMVCAVEQSHTAKWADIKWGLIGDALRATQTALLIYQTTITPDEHTTNSGTNSSHNATSTFQNPTTQNPSAQSNAHDWLQPVLVVTAVLQTLCVFAACVKSQDAGIDGHGADVGAQTLGKLAHEALQEAPKEVDPETQHYGQMSRFLTGCANLSANVLSLIRSTLYAFGGLMPAYDAMGITATAASLTAKPFALRSSSARVAAVKRVIQKTSEELENTLASRYQALETKPATEEEKTAWLQDQKDAVLGKLSTVLVTIHGFDHDHEEHQEPTPGTTTCGKAWTGRIKALLHEGEHSKPWIFCAAVRNFLIALPWLAWHSFKSIFLLATASSENLPQRLKQSSAPRLAIGVPSSPPQTNTLEPTTTVAVTIPEFPTETANTNAFQTEAFSAASNTKPLQPSYTQIPAPPEQLHAPVQRTPQVLQLRLGSVSPHWEEIHRTRVHATNPPAFHESSPQSSSFSLFARSNTAPWQHVPRHQRPTESALARTTKKTQSTHAGLAPHTPARGH